MLKSVQRINESVNNTIQYMPDSNDYWQPPQETLSLKTGDCEDIAILKFFLLLNNGISENNLRLCYCTYNGEAHIITMYFQDNIWWVLDNNVDDVYDIEEYTAINEKFRFNRYALWIGDRLTNTLPMKRIKKWQNVVESARNFSVVDTNEGDYYAGI